MSTDAVLSIAAVVVPVAFVVGHMVGYWRGVGRITCPTCHGRGSVKVHDDDERADHA